MSRHIALAAAALWLLAGVAAPVRAVVVQPAPLDRRIAAEVKDALDQTASLHGAVHVIDVQQGVVFLGSESATFLGQFHAIAAATRVAGVREVRMRLTGTNERRDDELTRVTVAGRHPEVRPDDHVIRDDASSETELGHTNPIRITPEMAAAATRMSESVGRGVGRIAGEVGHAWVAAATDGGA